MNEKLKQLVESDERLQQDEFGCICFSSTTAFFWRIDPRDMEVRSHQYSHFEFPDGHDFIELGKVIEKIKECLT